MDSFALAGSRVPETLCGQTKIHEFAALCLINSIFEATCCLQIKVCCQPLRLRMLAVLLYSMPVFWVPCLLAVRLPYKPYAGAVARGVLGGLLEV